MADNENVKILKQRYSKGEISKRKYLEMLNDLKEDEEVPAPAKHTNITQSIKNPAKSNIPLYLGILIVVIIIIAFVGFGNQNSTPKSIVPSCSYSNTCLEAPTCPSGTYLNTNGSTPICAYKTTTTTVGQQQCNGSTCTFNVTILPSCDVAYPNCSYYDTSTCKCLGSCYNGWTKDNATGFCEPPPQCSSNYYYDSSLGKCVLDSACPANYNFNPQSQYCVS